MRQSLVLGVRRLVAMLIVGLLVAGCSSKKVSPLWENRKRFEVDQKKVDRDRKQGYEVPLEFTPSQLLPASLISSKLFTIASPVMNDGAFNHYVLSVSSDELYAGSTTMLQKRAHEAEVILELKRISSSQAFLNALGETGVDIVLAPVRSVSYLANAVINPSETWEKITGAPAGVGRMASSVYDQVRDGVKKGSEAVGISSSQNEGEEGSDSKEGSKSYTSEEVLESATNFTLKYFGFNLNSRVREWQEQLGIDPYSDTQIIHDEIDRIATVESGVKVGSRFLPGIGGLAYVGQINRVLRMAEKLSLYEDPRELVKKQFNFLSSLSLTNSEIKELLTSEIISPTMRAVLIDKVQDLGIPTGSERLFRELLRYKTNEGVLGVIQGVARIAQLHKEGAKIREIFPVGIFVVGIRSDNTVNISAALDYLFWTSDESGLVIKLKERISNASLRGSRVELLGKASDRTKGEMSKLGLQVIENVSFPELVFWQSYTPGIGISSSSSRKVEKQ